MDTHKALKIAQDHGTLSHIDGDSIIIHVPWTKREDHNITLHGADVIRIYSISQLYRELGY